jgi:glycosyltransferase involved in cell wall biosynthesis
MISYTIIIPVYNAERTLPRLCHSIEMQTMAPSEVLFIEDCSTDGSRSCLESLTTAHPTWKVFSNEKNIGVSGSRNRGIMLAESSYLLFLDADDWIEPTLLEKTSSYIEKYQPDVLAFGADEDFLDREGRTTYTASHSPKLQVADREHPTELADMIYMLEEKTLYGYVWNKIYRTEFLQKNHLIFPAVSFSEDFLFNRRVYDQLSLAVAIPDILYHYVNIKTAGRLTEKYLPEYFDLQKRRYQEFLDQQYALRGDRDDASLTLMAGRYFRSFASMTVRELNHGRSGAEVRAMIDKEMEQGSLYPLLRGHLHCSSPITRFLYQPYCDGKSGKALRHIKCFRWIRRHSGSLYDRLKQIR